MNDECIIIKKSINKPNYKIHKTEILGVLFNLREMDFYE